MKHAKKLVSILLVLAMALTLSVAAFAADTGSITVTNPHKDADGKYATYTAYKIFDLAHDAVNNAYTYTIDSVANESVYDLVVAYGDTIKLTKSTGSNFVVEVTEDFSAAAFAAYLKNNIDDLGAGTALTETDGTVSATGLALGYYFVDSTLGTLCALTSTDADAEITEKNEVPTVEKKVEEEANSGEWGDTSDAEIGEKVNYKSTITVAGVYDTIENAGALKYVLHDTMSAGLTFNNDVTVSLNGAPVDASNYTVTVNPTDGHTFDVTFSDDFCADLEDNDVIVVAYSATVNANAAIAGTGNPNEVKLSYGEESQFETETDETVTYVWEFDILKYTGATKTPLAGAEFTLSRDADGTQIIKLIATSEANTYRVATAAEITAGTGIVEKFTSPAGGKIYIEGLDSGEYYLIETKAPEGYNALTAPVKVTIADNSDAPTTAQATVEVENNTGAELPETGGMGTTVLYVIGALLVVGAIVLLVSKKRMSMAEAAE